VFRGGYCAGFEAYFKQKQTQQALSIRCEGARCCEKHIIERYLDEVRKNLRVLIIKSSKIDQRMYEQVRVRARALYVRLEKCSDCRLFEDITSRVKIISNYELWIQKLLFSQVYADNTETSKSSKFFIGDLPENVIKLISCFVNSDRQLEFLNILQVLDNILFELQHTEIAKDPFPKKNNLSLISKSDKSICRLM